MADAVRGTPVSHLNSFTPPAAVIPADSSVVFGPLFPKGEQIRVAEVVTDQGSTPSPRVTTGDVNVTLSADALLLIGGLTAWLMRSLWVRVMQPHVVSKLDSAFAPVEEERNLNLMVTQVGLLTQASRVILAAFHNGSVDHTGYHYNKLTAVNTYAAPGAKLPRQPVHNLPMGRVMPELESLIRSPATWVHYNTGDSRLAEGCRNYMQNNGIHRISNHLVRVGNLPIAILSVQWDDPESAGTVDLAPPYSGLMEQALVQMSIYMRRRVVQPTPFQTLAARLKNPLGSGG